MASRQVNSEEHYRNRIVALVTEQSRHHPMAFGLMDAPNENTKQSCIYEYWEAEKDIQYCLNRIRKLNEEGIDK